MGTGKENFNWTTAPAVGQKMLEAYKNQNDIGGKLIAGPLGQVAFLLTGLPMPENSKFLPR